MRLWLPSGEVAMAAARRGGWLPPGEVAGVGLPYYVCHTRLAIRVGLPYSRSREFEINFNSHSLPRPSWQRVQSQRVWTGSRMQTQQSRKSKATAMDDGWR